jgi:hypothetical protein
MKQYTFTMSIKQLTLAFFLIFGAGIFAGNAQSGAERVMFIRVQDLNPDDYFKIAEQYKNNDMVFVKQACIPAEVIMFGIGSQNNLSLDDNFNLVKGVVLEKTNLTQVSIMAEYTEEAFLNRCKSFRTGSIEQ